ncbi:MAG TPA: permease [Nocardioidaceae bacterium]|nr:permease [Nocardioidaceae bacterium]
MHDLVARPAVANFATVFVAIVLQAVPFLALGVTVSAAIGTFVPPGLLPRLLPKNPAVAVPVGAVAGVALPGCECGSVPIARRLVDRGAPGAAALTFLLAAPAINPVVLVATAVAFPGQPEMVVARFAASLLAAVVVGWIWIRLGRDDLLLARRSPHVHADTKGAAFLQIAQHDFLNAGGFLIIGAATAGALQTIVPRSILTSLSGDGVIAVLALACLAVVMAICSEADAFIAASLRQFSPTAQLAFMTVGPMVDVKLIALQAGTFGRGFALRFAPLTFVVATSSAALVGWWLL